MLDAGAAVAAALAVSGSGDGDGDGGDSDGGGGGGAMSAAWLLALCAAIALLARRGGGSALAVAGLAAALWAAPAASWADGNGAVRGLIVQLRDAPSHGSVARERAQALAQGAGSAAEGREQARWLRLAAAAFPSLRVAERRAVGASAQLLRFERPMTAVQAQALADTLVRSPDVAWALPNTRERRLQVALGPPSRSAATANSGGCNCGRPAATACPTTSAPGRRSPPAARMR